MHNLFQQTSFEYPASSVLAFLTDRSFGYMLMLNILAGILVLSIIFVIINRLLTRKTKLRSRPFLRFLITVVAVIILVMHAGYISELLGF